MLKKAGIVVATSAAALLAVSPLAFAGDYNDDDNGGGGHHHSRSHHSSNHGGDCDQDNSADQTGRSRRGGGGLIDVSRNAIQVPIQACNNNVINNVVVGILSKNQSAESSNG